ncbi:hypothetical protein JCM33374_g613 [Metschnikowia sp. JCM 33374]|nr:hypothetical protein JCM33374_g613 [Metschnikowia sp. JCM 33374]
MGNTPTKEIRPRSSSLSAYGSGQAGAPSSRSARRNTTSASSAVSSKSSGKPEEKLRIKERHALDLVVRFRENVDGGYLAPYGTYKSNLDFDTKIVRDLVVARRLAPFYTPLQDFDDSWTEDEIVALVRQNPLHALDSAYGEEEVVEDLDDHKIHHSQNYFKRQEQKRRLSEILARVKEQQRICENEYFQARTSDGGNDADLSSRDLVLKLYRDATECPICFLYFPSPLNYSRCCRQPICTECFVQIKRLDPHPPHDEPEVSESPGQPKQDELPHTLISEPANCPYCAMSNFGVTYEPPRDVHVGRGSSMKPSEYSEKSSIVAIPENADDPIEFCEDSTQHLKPSPTTNPRKPRRRSSVAAESDLVITTDDIRPGWEQKLASAKSRLARKAAAASAIHASNLIIRDEGSSSRNAQGQNTDYIMSLEDRMVQEAMKLSLLDEEERLAKEQREKEKGRRR